MFDFGDFLIQAAIYGRLTVRLLFNLGSNNSLPGLFIALCIAMTYTLSRTARPRSIRFAVMRRAILPKRLFASASGRADILFTLASFLVFSLFIGVATVSQGTVRAGVVAGLSGLGAPGAFGAIPISIQMGVTTVALYLGYELAYWVDHYLSHRVPFLWQFHAVHHTAESLSPLTVFRVHPIDTIVFGNITGLVMGTIAAVLEHAFNAAPVAFTISGTNALLLAGFMLLTTLQHSHFWISFHGQWGKVFLSPAHHQIHHSKDPVDFNRNLGSTLAVWDWLFGTLRIPSAEREKLEFGVAGIPSPHSLRSTILRPFIEAARQIRWAMPARDRTKPASGDATSAAGTRMGPLAQKRAT